MRMNGPLMRMNGIVDADEADFGPEEEREIFFIIALKYDKLI